MKIKKVKVKMLYLLLINLMSLNSLKIFLIIKHSVPNSMYATCSYVNNI